VQKVVAAALGRSRFTKSRDGGREIVWPSNTNFSKKTPYRGAGGRDHGDIPLPELAGLAEVLHTEGLDDEEIVRRMQEHFDLERLAASTRERFEAAVKLSVTMRQV
jgi:hypothetical protein